MTEAPTSTPIQPERIVAVDAFRGMTIAGMILVNNPGSWRHIYAPLRHAKWHGWTPTDLVFPFFLFIVGVSICLAFSRRLDAGMTAGNLMPKVIRRGLILIGLGWFMAGYPFYHWESLSEGLGRLRIPGVLPRIGVCYMVVSAMFLFLPRASLRWICVGCLFGYWGLMTLVPVPLADGSYGPPTVDDKSQNLAAWLDRLLLDGHLWRSSRTWDPEGILSTIPAIATTLFGVFTGQILSGRERDTNQKVRGLLAPGAMLVAAGYVWSFLFPINKPLWTSSYAVFTAGLAMLTLALCVWIIDVRGWKRVAQPFVVYGVNAITVFVMSGLIAKTLSRIQVGDTSLKGFLYQNLFASWLEPKNASLGYALLWILGWYAVLWVMYRRRWIIKV